MGGPAGLEPGDQADEMGFCEACNAPTYSTTGFCQACLEAMREEDQDQRANDLRRGK